MMNKLSPIQLAVRKLFLLVQLELFVSDETFFGMAILEACKTNVPAMEVFKPIVDQAADNRPAVERVVGVELLDKIESVYYA